MSNSIKKNQNHYKIASLELVLEINSIIEWANNYRQKLKIELNNSNSFEHFLEKNEYDKLLILFGKLRYVETEILINLTNYWNETRAEWDLGYSIDQMRLFVQQGYEEYCKCKSIEDKTFKNKVM